MDLTPALLLGFSTAYDPPCDPGFYCEGLSDDALSGAVILWLIVLGGCVVLIIFGTIAGWTKSLYWRFKYGSADGVTPERETLRRRGYQDITVERRKGKVLVTWWCPDCKNYNINVPYLQLAGKSQVEACENSVCNYNSRPRVPVNPMVGESTAPTSRASGGTKAKPVGLTYFNFRCQTCNNWAWIDYDQKFETSPPQVCKKCDTSTGI